MLSVAGLVAQEVPGATAAQVEHTIGLISQGATVPFISRYRKEATGGLDEVAVGRIKELLEHFTELEKRKETILHTIDGQGKLTPELRQRIQECTGAAELEDLYLPYKPKRRTRATVAREKGLEPLAAVVMRQDGGDIQRVAVRFVDPTKGVESIEEALQGAQDIIAEWISESPAARARVRKQLHAKGEIVSKVVKGKETGEEARNFSDYFDFAEPLKRSAGHRVLAMFRGEKQGFLRLTVRAGDGDQEDIIERLEKIFLKGGDQHEGQSVLTTRELVRGALADAYKRLLRPSIETELLGAAKEQAEVEAIGVFADNLRQLLLAPPLGGRRVMGIDPGFRTGCKVVCLDQQGGLLHNDTIYPHPPQRQAGEAMMTLERMIEKYRVQAIAIGSGTAGRETESLVRGLHPNILAGVKLFMVSEDGASVYSASEAAREEFPDYDVTVRGAVSIGRRLMDPLAELVKIDPKSIGVGQYQHDVDQTKLKKSLDTVVESCVNRVGVSLNTASKHLLTYVSGLGETLARNIVEYRARNGAFGSRRELLKVPRLGEKAFEQAAGFLRIEGAQNPLDDTAVHPESYSIIENMAADLGVTVGEVIKNSSLRQSIHLKNYVTKGVGIPTLTAIMNELSKEGRDPRGEAKDFQFAEGINSIEDLQVGMVLPGIVTNITQFGAFVNVGAKQDGLVHISQLANKYVQNPADVVSIGEHVQVKVMEVDLDRRRIGLSIKALIPAE